jgi:hypothetical protein
VVNRKEDGRAQCQQGIRLVMYQVDILIEPDRRCPDFGNSGMQTELVDAQLHIFIEIGFDQFGGVRLCHWVRLATGRSPDNANS